MPLATCAGCPLATTGQGFCPDLLRPNSQYVIVGEAPGRNELVEKTPFIGDAGFVLRNWLIKAVPQLQIALEKKRVSFVNILHCLPPMVQGRPYPKGKERLEAEKHCTQYRELGDAPVAILCGESPQRYFFATELEGEDAVDRQLGHDVKGVMGRIGRVYERDGRRWVFAPHPAYILRQPALVQHGQEALKIAVGSDTVVDVAYTKWEDALDSIYPSLH